LLVFFSILAESAWREVYMEANQLEFDLDNNPVTNLLPAPVQLQVDQACTTMGKVRRKVFAMVGVMVKDNSQLRLEFTALKEQVLLLTDKIRVLENEKQKWKYGQGDSLFSERESTIVRYRHQQAS
jgi:hypothetical protein